MAMGWALVSPGKHADSLVAPAISIAEDTQLVAVCSRDQARADAFAAKHGAQAAYTSLEDLVADARVDAVFIASPNFLHAPYTTIAAQAGKHVLVEKPMAVRVDEAVEMVRTCRAHDVKLGVGFHMRYHPGHQEARRLIGEGVLGTITLVQAQMGAGIRGRTEIPLEVFRDARSGQRST
jgi:predicted dehydrogenase